MALDVGGRFAEAERAYEWLRAMQHADGSWHAYYLGDDGEGAHARHQRHLLRRERRVAPLPRDRRHRLPRASCSPSSSARSTSRSTTSTRPARSSGTPTRSASTARARCSPARRASTRRCAARSRPPSASAASAPTGSCRSARSPSRSRTGPSASSTRNAGRWTGTTRSSAACCAATRPKRASRRSGTRSSSPGRGVRCVSDQPWITAAETCELVMALDAIGLHDRARDAVRVGAVPAPRRRQLLDRHELRRRALRRARRATSPPSSRRGTARRSCSPRTRSAGAARPRACSAARACPPASPPRSSSRPAPRSKPTAPPATGADRARSTDPRTKGRHWASVPVSCSGGVRRSMRRQARAQASMALRGQHADGGTHERRRRSRATGMGARRRRGRSPDHRRVRRVALRSVARRRSIRRRGPTWRRRVPTAAVPPESAIPAAPTSRRRPRRRPRRRSKPRPSCCALLEVVTTCAITSSSTSRPTAPSAGDDRGARSTQLADHRSALAVGTPPRSPTARARRRRTVRAHASGHRRFDAGGPDRHRPRGRKPGPRTLRRRITVRDAADITAGVAVKCRRFGDRWVDGFEICEVMRDADGAALPAAAPHRRRGAPGAVRRGRHPPRRDVRRARRRARSAARTNVTGRRFNAAEHAQRSGRRHRGSKPSATARCHTWNGAWPPSAGSSNTSWIASVPPGTTCGDQFS